MPNRYVHKVHIKFLKYHIIGYRQLCARTMVHGHNLTVEILLAYNHILTCICQGICLNLPTFHFLICITELLMNWQNQAYANLVSIICELLTRTVTTYVYQQWCNPKFNDQEMDRYVLRRCTNWHKNNMINNLEMQTYYAFQNTWLLEFYRHP